MLNFMVTVYSLKRTESEVHRWRWISSSSEGCYLKRHRCASVSTESSRDIQGRTIKTFQWPINVQSVPLGQSAAQRPGLVSLAPCS